MNTTMPSNEMLPVDEQREELLENNYDKLYWVYELISENSDSITISLVKNCLVAFKNQLNNLIGLEKYPSISILDLNALSKGNIETLYWNNVEFWNRKIIMCSWGMMDFFSPGNFSGTSWKQNLHMITSLRDAWSTSHNQRTTVAGRILWDNIRKNIEIESAEESPFLWMMNWKFHLAIWNNYFEYLKEAVKLFLDTKYDPNNSELKKIFERWFRGLKYEDLWEVLLDIVKNNRFIQYETEELNAIEWLSHINKRVKIDNKEENFYVVFNPVLNTYEFKIIKRFKWFPEWFTIPWNRPNRLFLESYNQYPRLNRIQNANKINPSWAIKVFNEEIVRNIDKILK